MMTIRNFVDRRPETKVLEGSGQSVTQSTAYQQPPPPPPPPERESTYTPPPTGGSKSVMIIAVVAVVAIVALVAIFGIIMFSPRDSGNGGGGGNPIVGTWTINGTTVLVLNSDGTGLHGGRDITWSTSNGQLTMINPAGEQYVVSYSISSDGNTLTWTEPDGYVRIFIRGS